MITKIPEGQICQAFDPRVNKPQEILKNHNTTEQPNSSCLANAYVYVEGKHGKKFLCDIHYYYEIYMNKEGYSAPGGSWKDIQQYIVDERERVKDTFAKNVTSTETLGHKCSIANYYNPGNPGCNADAFVKVNPISIIPGKMNYTHFPNGFDITQDIFYCNFHFRRMLHRHLNNGIVYEEYHKVLDERYRMTITIAEESSKIKYL